MIITFSDAKIVKKSHFQTQKRVKNHIFGYKLMLCLPDDIK